MGAIALLFHIANNSSSSWFFISALINNHMCITYGAYSLSLACHMAVSWFVKNTVRRCKLTVPQNFFDIHCVDCKSGVCVPTTAHASCQSYVQHDTKFVFDS